MPFPDSEYSSSPQTTSEEFVAAVLASLRVEFVPSEQRAAHSELGVTRRAKESGGRRAKLLRAHETVFIFDSVWES